MDQVNITWPPINKPKRNDLGTDKWAGVARLGGLGDDLIAASVLPQLKKKGYKVEVISQAPYHVVFGNNPNIDKLTLKGKDDLPKDTNQWQLWFADRAKEYDLFANLSHTCETLTVFFPAQTAFWWPAHYRRKIANRNYLEVVHDVFGMPHEFGPLFFPTSDELEAANKTKATMGKQCIAWCLSGTRIDKLYPYTPMAVARIIKEFNIPVVLLGAPHAKHHEMSKVIEEHVERENGSTRGLHLALSHDVDKPNWHIRRVLSLAHVCDLVIGPDTGPMWGVAFEQSPKIMLLSHASEENITKHWKNTITLHANQSRVPCWPCHRLHDDLSTCTPNKWNNGSACISDISIDDIMNSIQSSLSHHFKSTPEVQLNSGESNG